MYLSFSHVQAHGKSLLIFSVCAASFSLTGDYFPALLNIARSEAIRQKFHFNESVLVVHSASIDLVFGDERLASYVRIYGEGPLDRMIQIPEPGLPSFRFSQN